jgi:hypothetical protein
MIGFTGPQRQWMEIGLGPNEYAMVRQISDRERGDIEHASRIDVEVSFAKRNVTTEDPYPSAELGASLTKVGTKVSVKTQ